MDNIMSKNIKPKNLTPKPLTPEPLTPKLAIVGLGLMGGSLGLAARAHGIVVAAYARRQESRQKALKLGVADEVFDAVSDAVKNADMVVICTPIFTMPELVKAFVSNLKDGCIVTDVGSTKGFLAEEINAILSGSQAEFVGSHPMAGSEKTGLDAATISLYEDALVIVTPAKETNISATKKVIELWEMLGAKVAEMTPQKHDEIISRTSHLPHLIAATLIAGVDRDDTNIAQYCGPGIRDATRIAEGSEIVWHDIVKSNCDAILNEINVFGEELSKLQKMLEQKDFDAVRNFLADSREKRAKFDS